MLTVFPFFNVMSQKSLFSLLQPDIQAILGSRLLVSFARFSLRRERSTIYLCSPGSLRLNELSNKIKGRKLSSTLEVRESI